ncbi:hypothetical protein C8R44DRAFT_766845, partial [Mycena epipterygia]
MHTLRTLALAFACHFRCVALLHTAVSVFHICTEPPSRPAARTPYARLQATHSFIISSSPPLRRLRFPSLNPGFSSFPSRPSDMLAIPCCILHLT